MDTGFCGYSENVPLLRSFYMGKRTAKIVGQDWCTFTGHDVEG